MTGWAHLHPDAQAAEPLPRTGGTGTTLTAPWHDASSPPRGPRTALRVLGGLGALVLLVVGIVVAMATFGGDDDDSAADDGPSVYFSAEAAALPGGGEPFGLALGTPVELLEQTYDGEVERRVEVRVEGVRRVDSGGYADLPEVAPGPGGYLLVDVAVRPLDGPVALDTTDFSVRLPDGRDAEEVSSDAGWYDLWPDNGLVDDEARLAGPRTSTLVFAVDLATVDGALLAVGYRDTVATWELPAGAPPQVAPQELPGYVD